MPIEAPKESEIAAIAEDLGMHLDADAIREFAALSAPFVSSAAALDAIPDDWPEPRYARTGYQHPDPDANRLGAWYVRTRIDGAPSGVLRGRTVALKDNVMLAGVPMMNGSRLLEGYIPPIDATVATRLLDAGATIVGKAVCEAFCLSGGSHTSESGPVRNPHDPTRHAGGSSSGCAALVAAGEVDLAIGGDQGGSIRMPSSFCGAVGMKPTHGLVPYTGILSLEATLDHAGPITANVADNALLLGAIAGADGVDSRQRNVQVDDYSAGIGVGVEGLRIATLEEGFAQPGSEPEVDAAVRRAAARFERLGAKLSRVSIPEHRRAGALSGPVFQSAIVQVFYTDGVGVGTEDLRVPDFADRMRQAKRRADELPDTLKTFLFGMEVLRRRYGWRYYAKAINAVRRIRAAYDAQLEQVDVLLLPTTPMTAPKLPASDAGRAETLAAAMAPTANTLPFDHTHHPALSIPCGEREGMPIGLMLVGRAWQESTLYRAAHAFEQSS